MATEGRVSFVLGAGASVEAGLALTSGLARQLVGELNTSQIHQQSYLAVRLDTLRRAANFVYAAIVEHAAETGSSPLDAVNIERLISAVRLLAIRNSHESAPFVANWKAAVEAIDAHETAVTDREVSNSIGEAFSNGRTNLRALILRMINDSTGVGTGVVFQQLEQRLLQRTCAVLSDIDDVSYLRPITDLARNQPGGVDVITLNYDLTIETLGRNEGVMVDRGVERWAPGSPLAFPTRDRVVNLIKVHGSIDWQAGQTNEDFPTQTIEVVEATHNPSPSIVLGDRGKLDQIGPTIPLLHAAAAVLTRTDHLVVCGYSFGDEHINQLLQNWLASDSTRTLTVLDPGWRPPQRTWEAPMTFIDHLQKVATIPLSEAAGRILIRREPASAGLTRAIQERPLPRLSATFECSIEQSGDNFLLVLHNHGYDATSLNVTATRWGSLSSVQVLHSTTYINEDQQPGFLGNAPTNSRSSALLVLGSTTEPILRFTLHYGISAGRVTESVEVPNPLAGDNAPRAEL